ncbi:MAG: sulfurtransferase TusA family protein [Dehalococcoidia bacterium]|nr:sulfurtransferase TusA family protein [Dehalococcoidia bacterium]
MEESNPAGEISETLDCIGLYCPMPILKTREKMDELGVGEVLEVLADDPASEPDIKAWAKRTGQRLLSVDRTDEGFRFLIRKTN